MENPDKSVHPTVQPDTGLKIKIPDTPEGRQFLEDLKRLLKVEDLPFQKVCSAGHGQSPTHLKAKAASASDNSGSTTYGLDLRVEQEGWAP